MDQETREVLIRKRSAGVGVLRRNGYIATAQVYSAFILGGLGNFVALIIFNPRNQVVEFSFSIVAAVMFIVASVMFARRWSARNRNLTVNGQIVQAPEAIHREIAALLGSIATRMNFDLSKLELSIAKRVFTATPSIAESNGRAHLILPLGFLKVLRETPDVARAMLVHELGHADQRDIKLWSLANIYWVVVTRTLLPFLSLLLLLHLIGTASAVIQAREDTARAEQAGRVALEENDKALAQAIEEIQGRVYPEPGFYVGLGGPPPSRESDTSSADMAHEWQEFLIEHESDRARSRVKDAIIESLLKALPLGFQVVVLMLMFYSIRHLRRLSEEMADLAVVIYDDGYALQRALETFGKPSRRWQPFALHPTTQGRLRRVVEDMRLKTS